MSCLPSTVLNGGGAYPILDCPQNPVRGEESVAKAGFYRVFASNLQYKRKPKLACLLVVLVYFTSPSSTRNCYEGPTLRTPRLNLGKRGESAKDGMVSRKSTASAFRFLENGNGNCVENHFLCQF
jgi:hypothetical protein